MTEQVDQAVYRVRGLSENHWQVCYGSCIEPLATFQARHAALAYALDLAREHGSSPPPHGRYNRILRSILNQSRLHE